MLEIIVLFMLIFFISACFYSPEGRSRLTGQIIKLGDSQPPCASSPVKIPEDSMLKRHFLTQMQSEIEAALFPRPTDSVLQRHYDNLVAVELQNRLQTYR